jgi:FtsH-binding integral membrane protein
MDYPLASQASESARGAFIRRTYAHLAGAVLAFVGLETLLFKSGVADSILDAMMAGGRGGLLIALVAFIGAGYLAQWWALNAASRAMQYAGLGLYVVVEAIIFIPLLGYAAQFRPEVIPQAGVLTTGIFCGLSVAVFIGGRDYSRLGPILSVASFGLCAFALAGWLFGFNLGLVFCFAVVALACGYIIYDTSNIIHRYRTDQHVAAALALFADVALLYYYILRILLAASNRD